MQVREVRDGLACGGDGWVPGDPCDVCDSDRVKCPMRARTASDRSRGTCTRRDVTLVTTILRDTGVSQPALAEGSGQGTATTIGEDVEKR